MNRPVGAGMKSRVKRMARAFFRSNSNSGPGSPDAQDLDLYWDPAMAALLDSWGEGTTWNEIQYLLINCSGRVLDIACGTGKVMSIIAKYPCLDMYGFDISDFLIEKALARGIAPSRLKVMDATKPDYGDNEFDYSYSIGSLEHFTEDGITKFLSESARITARASFHMIPVSRSGKNEGWMKTLQSFHNNSLEWWLQRFNIAYASVHVLDSAWVDDISVGKWFICQREPVR
jgi:ubiquinone/menaquinone biosynthesis C-methylase UbiE